MKILQYGELEAYSGKCPNCGTVHTEKAEEVRRVIVLNFLDIITFSVEVSVCPYCGTLHKMTKRIHDYEQ